jgi:tetratricopeptide (TPR) repeat protein
MKRLGLTSLLLAVLWLSDPVGSSTALARPSEAAQHEAKERYDRGVELFKEGDYRAALIEFERAHELSPHYRVLYNIGQVHYLLKDYASALTTLSAYLDQGGDRISAKRRRSVEQDLAKLRPRVALLEVDVDSPGAEVLVDDVSVGTSPLEGPLTVSAGRRKVTVIARGQEPISKFVDVAGSEDRRISFELGGASPRPTGTDGDEPGGSDDRETTTATSGGADYLWIGWAVTGALSVSSIVTGALALEASGDLDDARARQTSRDELDDLSSRTLTLSVATDVLAGGAIAAAAVTGIVLLTRDSTPADDEAAHSRTWRIEPASTPGGAGLRLLF